MKKLSWLKRIFMSYSALQEHFGGADNAGIKELLEKQLVQADELNKERTTRINEKEQMIQKLQSEINVLTHKEQESTNKSRELEVKLNTLNEQRAAKEQQLNSIRNEKDLLKNEIDNKLKTLTRIEKTFFGVTGNKGKGEFGERQLATALEASGLAKDFYVNNLQVNSKNVEFAIKSGDEGKWIPVDSKVLEPNYDEEGIPIIDKAYVDKVKAQAKKVNAYLGKANTANYGLLVLQSDDIYMRLYEFDPAFFQETIKNMRIHISSPSSFIQFASSISHILDIYEKVHNEEKLYDEIIGLMNTTRDFAENMKKTHSAFNVAMNKHYPALENKHKSISKIVTSDKVKQLKGMEEK